jgi:hypothetical protein
MEVIKMMTNIYDQALDNAIIRAVAEGRSDDDEYVDKLADEELEKLMENSYG